MDKDGIVERKLNEFLQQFKSFHDSNLTDEVVVSYVIGVLETLDDKECFSLEEFIEVMSAYVPGFEMIDSKTVFDWLETLRNKISESEKTLLHTEEKPSSPTSKVDTGLNFSCSLGSVSESLHQVDGKNKCETKSEVIEKFEEENGIGDKVQSIKNIFPDRSAMEIMKCLSIANEDVSQAIQLLLESEDEMGVDFTDCSHTYSISSQVVERQDKSKDNDNVKDFVLSRYSYVVDTETDSKVYSPSLPKTGPKKLVRYRDNQIVTTKGERFWKAKEAESEEIKRTYVNLKPARKYRFH